MKISTTSKNIYFILGIIFLLGVWVISSILINNSGILPNIDEVSYILVNILKDQNTYLLLGNTFLKIFCKNLYFYARKSPNITFL